MDVSADHNLWQFTDAWVYDPQSESMISNENTSNGGYYLTQVVNTTLLDTANDFTLEIEYSANNTSDVNEGDASIVYKVIGISNYTSLSDAQISGRINTGSAGQALSIPFLPNELSPSGTL